MLTKTHMRFNLFFGLRKSFKFIFIDILIVIHGVSFAQWVKVNETPGMIIFMDVHSLAAPASNRVINVLIDFREPENGNDELVSMINQVEFFCRERLRRVLSATHYGKNMGLGEPTYKQFEPGTVRAVNDHDGWDPVMQIVCKPANFKP